MGRSCPTELSCLLVRDVAVRGLPGRVMGGAGEFEINHEHHPRYDAFVRICRTFAFRDDDPAELDRIDMSGLDARTGESEFLVACDVSNPLTGPEGASWAILNARRMIGAISSARSTCTAHLVTGAAMATKSWPSTGSSSRMRLSCWPAVTIIGEFALAAL